MRLLVLTVVFACAAPTPSSAPPPPVEATPLVVTSTAPPPPLMDCPDDAGLCLVVVPPSAEILVDGEARGRAVDAGGFLPLTPGIYQITLRAPGYRPWRAEVAVKAPAQELEVRLEKE